MVRIRSVEALISAVTAFYYNYSIVEVYFVATSSGWNVRGYGSGALAGVHTQLKGNYTNFTGSGSSARSVDSSSRGVESSGVADSLTQYLQQIYRINQENTARSEAQAAQLRSWQEQQNKIAMDFNAAEAAKNRDWQQMMSNTAHQREVKDLQAAGLNPILSASGGNGAAVTSGATASGVTSSGAMGEVDKSATQALVSLIGTMWQAQTTLESQRLNAQNNMAIAEKNNATSQMIAQMQTQSQQEVARISGQYGLDIAGVNGAISKLVAQIHAGATVTASQVSAAAHKYASDLGYAGTQLQVAANLIANEARNQNALDVAGVNYDATIGSANIHSQSALDVARENHWNNIFGFSKNTADGITSLLPWLNKSGSGVKRGSGFSK